MTASTLPAFEGKPVLKMAARVTGAGDGLSDPLAVGGEPHHHGDEVFIVLRCEVSQINHKPAQRDDPDHLVRVETYSAIEGTLVGADDVSHLLEASAEKVREAKEAEEAARQAQLLEDEEAARLAEEREAGIMTLDDAGDPDEEPVPPPATEEELAAARADREAADELEAARAKRRSKKEA